MNPMFVGLGVAAVGIGGMVFASAATLGTLTQDTLGATTSVTASCDTDGVDVDNWGSSYSVANTRYDTTTFDIINIAAACDGKLFKVTLADSGGNSLAETTGTLSLTGGAESFTVAAVSSEAVARVAVVFYG
ncbi:MAG: hypothetical protein H6525_01160 [Actinobacteria bacterium]|nr:hypothetical protein [Actinomycetota bacterium]MCB9411452.1 hypothetical protein [Actinomycetota bacterium]